MLIYKIVNQVNGDFYIGKTTKPKNVRLQEHFYNSSYNSQTYLHRAIRKYGCSNFIIEEIETKIPEEKLDEREIFWINNLNPTYNMTSGGEGGDTSLSPNFIKSMKEYHNKKPKEEYATYGMLGKKFPEEAKRKVSRANSYPVVCEGREFPSIKAAEEYYKSLGTPKSVRKRIDSSKHPDWYRIRNKRIYK
jgi:group I intron endonuclease